MRYGSLFSGIGGLDLGLDRAGMTCAWQVEIDDYATRVLTKHWPNVPKFRDVRAVGKHNLGPVDLICGGFPCQPHSLAGKRQGSADERDLWGEFARLIGELRPRYVLAENTPGLLTSDDRRFFGGVLRDLAACGYDAEWDHIPAAAVGAPHIRDRVFILAYPQVARGRQQPGSGHRTNEADGRQINQRGAAFKAGQFTGNGQDGRAGHVADAKSAGLAQRQVFGGTTERLARFKHGSMDERGSAEHWAVEPPVGRMVDGFPGRVDRLRGLGNAVVPQVAEWIGRLIMEAAHA